MDIAAEVESIYLSIKSDLSSFFARYSTDHGQPTVESFIVGNDPSAESYLRSKIRVGESLGVRVIPRRMEADASESEIMEAISRSSESEAVNGIMIEAPVPGHINIKRLQESIDPEKDIDCATSRNLGAMMKGNAQVIPATVRSISRLLDIFNLPRGSLITIVNRSVVIGKPLAMELLSKDYTVAVAHSKTADLKSLCRYSAGIVVAVGSAGFLTKDYVTDKSIVVDAGINYVEGKLKGDADYQNLSGFVRGITPVPGGVGRLTQLYIFQNLKLILSGYMK
ncbi:MAG: bifunctional 5,10-methylenetetrahydrofolate dehydrogenase/5,10-methenyltetrahydrofolate cyclohydrolase [Thermoplasmataceae archaeon]